MSTVLVKITELPAALGPFIGTEEIPAVSAGTTYKFTARDFVLPMDPFLTAIDMSATFPGARILTAGAGITLTDGGAGGPLTITASGGGTGIVVSVVAGAGITVDATDPANPIVAVDLAANYNWLGDHDFAGNVNFSGEFRASGVEGTDGQVWAANGAGLAPSWKSASGGSIDLGYNFNTNTANSDPGAQKLKFDFAGFNATAIYFDETAFNNFNANTILSLLNTGNRIYIQQRNGTNAVVYEVTGVGTHHVGYWEIPVSMVDFRGVLFANNADLVCVFILSASSSGGTPGGSDTQVQYNDAGAFGGSAFLTLNDVTGLLTATTVELAIGSAPADVGIQNAVGQFVIYTAGNPVAVWDAAGIFTTVTPTGGGPAVIFNAQASGTALQLTDGTVTANFSFVGGSQFNLGTAGAHPVRVLTNATERVVVSSLGRVSINAPSSGDALTVFGLSGASTLLLSANGGSTLQAGWASGLVGAAWNFNTDGSDPLAIGTAGGATLGLYTSGTLRLSIIAAGNVAITAPSSGIALTVTGFLGSYTANFTVVGNAVPGGIAVTNTGAGAGTLTRISLNDGSGNLGYLQGDPIGNTVSLRAVDRNDRLDFWTGTAGGAQRVSIGASGNTTINAVASGITLTVGAGASGSISLSVAALTAQIVQRWNDGTVNADLTTAGTKVNLGTTTAHAFDIYTNGVVRISTASAGAVTINAPTSGIALSVVAASGTQALALTAAAATNAIAMSFDVASATSENLITMALNGTIKLYTGLVGTAGNLITGSLQNDFGIRLQTANFLVSGDAGTTVGLKVSSTNVVSIYDGSALQPAGFRGIPIGPTFSGSVSQDGVTNNGKMIRYVGGSGDTVTIQDGVAGQLLMIMNNGGGTLSIADGLTGVLRWFSGSAATDGSRTLAVGGVCSILWNDSQNCLIWGNGLT